MKSKRWSQRLRLFASIGLVAWVIYVIGHWFTQVATDPYDPPRAPYVSVLVSAKHQIMAADWLHAAMVQVIDFWRFGS